jgi:hypothetical protein
MKLQIFSQDDSPSLRNSILADVLSGKYKLSYVLTRNKLILFSK